MKKNKKTLEKRKALSELAINNPEEAAKYFEFAALSLRQANNSTQRIQILSEILFLSTNTIEKDIYLTTENTELKAS